MIVSKPLPDYPVVDAHRSIGSEHRQDWLYRKTKSEGGSGQIVYEGEKQDDRQINWGRGISEAQC